MYKIRNIYNSYYDSLILFFRVRVKKEHFLSCFILRNCTTSDDDGYLLLKKLYCSKLLALFSLTLPVWLASLNISPCSTTTAPFLLGCLVWFGAAATSNSNNKHTILHIKHIRLLTVRTSSIPFHLCVCILYVCASLSVCPHHYHHHSVPFHPWLRLLLLNKEETYHRLNTPHVLL